MRCSTVLLIVGMMLASTAVVRACPNCAEAMPGSATTPPAASANPSVEATTPSVPQASPVPAVPPVRQAGLADGFYWSILLMLAVPYTLAAGVGLGIYQVARKRRPAVAPVQA